METVSFHILLANEWEEDKWSLKIVVIVFFVTETQWVAT